MAEVTEDPEQAILKKALTALGQTTGLQAKILEHQPLAKGTRRIDAKVEIQDNGQPFDIFVEVKTRIDRKAVLAAAHVQIGAATGEQGVLVTDYLTHELANYCQDNLNLQFIDTAGNAYLRRPGLFVLVKGQPRPTLAAYADTRRAAATTTAMRVIFLLLCEPTLLNAPYREIAKAAGVALGAVGPVLQDLVNRRYIIGDPGKRRFLEPVKLFEEWVMNYPVRLRPKLKARRFTAEDTNWWTNTQLPRGAFWGGEIAAKQLTQFLRPTACTIYVRPNATQHLLAKLAAEHKLRTDLNGNIEILEAFWELPTDTNRIDIAPAALVYADLVATLEPRNLEVAQMIRKQNIEDALRRA